MSVNAGKREEGRGKSGSAAPQRYLTKAEYDALQRRRKLAQENGQWVELQGYAFYVAEELKAMGAGWDRDSRTWWIRKPNAEKAQALIDAARPGKREEGKGKSGEVRAGSLSYDGWLS